MHTMKKTLRYTIIIVAAAAVAACCPCRYARKNPKPLAGTTWQLAQLSGIDMQCDPGTFEITFGINGRLTGVGSCNKFNAPYSVTPSRAIDIDTIVSTRRYCPLSEREQRLFRELDDATHYEIDGSMLMLLNNGEIRAIFTAPAATAAPAESK